MNTEISKIQNALLSKNFQEAEMLAWALYKKNSKNFVVLKTLGLTLLLQEKYVGSIDVYLKCMKINDDDFDVLCNLAYLYLKLEEFSQSYSLALRALDNPSANYLPYSQMAEILMRKRDFENSLKYCDLTLKMIDLNTLNKNIGIFHVHIDVLIALGKKNEAEKFIRYYQDKSFNDEVFQHHSSVSPETISDNEISKAIKFIDNESYPNHIIKARHDAPFLFGLAKYYDYKKDKKKSEEYFIKGNKEILKIQRYYPLSHQKNILKIKELFANNFYNNHITKNKLGDGLIFIVGMPRSGTTLLESIIGTNKNAISGGELLSMHYLSSKYYLENQESLDLEEYNNKSIGEIYLNRIKFIQGDRKYFIDKLPGNYHNIGFIKTFLPNAKIIYLQRDPWDVAISIYKQFYINNIPYAASFFNIAVNIANHAELIRFWKQEMQFDFMTVSYEELVTNTQEITKKIFDYIQMEGSYNEDLRKKFFSRTASKSQIAQGIHSASISKASFEDLKEKFYEALKNQERYWHKTLN